MILYKSLYFNPKLIVFIMKYTRQKYEEQKTEELKNKSTTDHKNSINSKETYKTNHNMASKNFPVIDSHVIS